VSAALQLERAHGANRKRAAHNFEKDAVMRVMNDTRLFGFDFGDWSMLLAGLMLAGALTLFV
jgi:hypothetical protein